jgi:endonuclease/exonuclease/phosphatase family metal-dependent hydrolase
MPEPVLDAVAGPAAPGDLEVMTFNLRYASPDGAASGRSEAESAVKRPRLETGTEVPHPWARRRPAMGALLRIERPHLIGTQEGLAAQLRDLGADLGDRYAFVGTGRDGGDRGEFAAVFHDMTRLSPQRSGHFWLSDTPDVVGSNTWAARTVRMVTWVLFADLVTGGRFYAVNTHLDHISEPARRRSAGLIRDRLAAFTPRLPIVLTGDFNAPAGPGNAVYDLLVTRAGYVDTWTAAAERGAAFGTCPGWGPAVPGGERIDWILTTPGVAVPAVAINPFRDGARCPSDHLPVQARLRLPTARPGRNPATVDS